MNGTLPAGRQSLVLREDAAGVATLTLNRPAQINALNVAMLDALQSALDAIANEPAVRVVVITGATQRRSSSVASSVAAPR